MTSEFLKCNKVCERLVSQMKAWSKEAAMLHNRLPQEDRDSNLEDFRKRTKRILVATHLLGGRGLNFRADTDPGLVMRVLCFDFPPTLDAYLHCVRLLTSS